MGRISSSIKTGPSVQAGKSSHFRLWAPLKNQVTLHLIAPEESWHDMVRGSDGYFEVELTDCPEHTLYYYKLDDGDDIPDPASHDQPKGVHGPSALVDHTRYPWGDHGWQNLRPEELICYELHVGTFTEQGTFEAIIPRLNDLKILGINAIELMPIAEFPGSRNWGYDGTFPFAVQHTYGGPDGLKKLVDACHQIGIAVYLDVVYNHLGPEGNYFHLVGPYFTDAYQTPWGAAINFDGPWSDGVRDYFASNALHWFHHYHIDGLRLDAIHAMVDNGAIHILQYINEQVDVYVRESKKNVYMIAESDLNAPRVIQHSDTGGYGFSAQWLDDFHHALFVLLYPEGKKRYEDFGTMEQLAKAYTDGFVHSGDYVKARKRRHGASSAGIPGFKFVAFIQNHDQVGNQKNGNRLSLLVPGSHLRIAAAALLLAPYIPLLFMGEEYGETKPFLYFTSHSDPKLVAQIRAGRRRQFADFLEHEEPPNPQAESSYRSCILDWSIRTEGKHGELLEWYKQLIALRRSHAALRNFDKPATQFGIIGNGVWALYRQDESASSHLLALFNLSSKAIRYTLPANTTWACLLDSTAPNVRAATTAVTGVLRLPPASVMVFASENAILGHWDLT
ncbi:malto-oligosyltrehalose trehalohydrolase [Parapedobacter sp.]